MANLRVASNAVPTRPHAPTRARAASIPARPTPMLPALRAQTRPVLPARRARPVRSARLEPATKAMLQPRRALRPDDVEARAVVDGAALRAVPVWPKDLRPAGSTPKKATTTASTTTAPRTISTRAALAPPTVRPRLPAAAWTRRPAMVAASTPVRRAVRSTPPTPSLRQHRAPSSPGQTTLDRHGHRVPRGRRGQPATGRRVRRPTGQPASRPTMRRRARRAEGR